MRDVSRSDVLRWGAMSQGVCLVGVFYIFLLDLPKTVCKYFPRGACYKQFGSEHLFLGSCCGIVFFVGVFCLYFP